MNNGNNFINKTENFVKVKLSGEGSGHDWWHVWRVWQLAKRINRKEKANLLIVELAALLHDVADWKFQDNGSEDAGAMVTKEWLENLKVEKYIISQVVDIVQNISFKGAETKNLVKTKEGKIVQDADRLDAMGAIGVGRTFAYGGFKHRQMHDPSIKVQIAKNFEEYKKAGNTTINHFYEKLLLLKNKMNTKTGKQIAQNRHHFMELFLREFYWEWNGKR